MKNKFYITILSLVSLTFNLHAESITMENTPNTQVVDAIESKKVVKILYTNWRGETGWREIAPESIRFGSTEWHPEEQWLLRAFDTEKKAYREFALKDIQKWNV